jgi:hypothetical protein
MKISSTRAPKSLFFPLLAVQLVLGTMIVIGLCHLGFWKTAVLEICKFALVLPTAFQFRRASLEPDTSGSAASLLATAATAMLAISALADTVLISYDIQLGIGH